MEFEPITTQEAFDAAVEARLEQERQTIAGNYQNQLETLQNQIAAHQRSESKLKVAREIGLPFEVAERLNGETEDELRRDAENLKRIFNLQVEEPMASTEPNSVDPKKVAMRQMLQGMKGE